MDETLAYRLILLPQSLAIFKLDPSATIPEWIWASKFLTITRTREECSIICDADQVPAEISSEGGWRALKMEGPFEFTQIGVLASVANPLAAAQVSILSIATYDTDYVLVTEPDLPTALKALAEAGHQVLA
ncbi:MAG TPA: ACT domain-containing protein [Bellilinea sp.]|nr:ACT domain-containing protein [Bellilinea sp.]